MTKIAITGYASLDHVIQMEAPPRPNETVIAARTTTHLLRLGGSPSYVAMAVVRAGIADAVPITWIAADEGGDRFIAALHEAKVPVDGIARSLPGHTPICILAYDPAGACYCIYDPAASRTATLTPVQADIVAQADWVCITVGPASATRDALSRMQPGQKLVWAVKADGDAFPSELRVALAARADLIVHSKGERPFVADALDAAPARADRIVIETRGAEGAHVAHGDRSELVPAKNLAASDPTGAGDTFIGGLLAKLIARPGDAVAAVRAGQEAAHAMLFERIEHEKKRKQL
ncbi:MAG TPA: carbohydrate kinase family protein [Magnetospirillaceae bacterium]|jgi:ribokinase